MSNSGAAPQPHQTAFRVLRVGGSYRVSTVGLLHVRGIDLRAWAVDPDGSAGEEDLGAGAWGGGGTAIYSSLTTVGRFCVRRMGWAELSALGSRRGGWEAIASELRRSAGSCGAGSLACDGAPVGWLDVSDDEVSDRGVDLAGEGAGDPGGQMEDFRRSVADRELLEELAAAGFAGPVYEVFAGSLAAYGLAVLMAWMSNGEIVARCKAAGRPLPGDAVPAAWSRDDRLELATETVARALDFFFRQVLQAGRWDDCRGASLKTFLVGACVLEFPNVFRLWIGEQQRWDKTRDRQNVEEAAGIAEAAGCAWTDPTGEAATAVSAPPRARWHGPSDAEGS